MSLYKSDHTQILVILQYVLGSHSELTSSVLEAEINKWQTTDRKERYSLPQSSSHCSRACPNKWVNLEDALPTLAP